MKILQILQGQILQIFQGQIWSGLPREGPEDRQMLCGKTHQNQKGRAEREGLKKI